MPKYAVAILLLLLAACERRTPTEPYTTSTLSALLVPGGPVGQLTARTSYCGCYTTPLHLWIDAKDRGVLACGTETRFTLAPAPHIIDLKSESGRIERKLTMDEPSTDGWPILVVSCR